LSTPLSDSAPSCPAISLWLSSAARGLDSGVQPVIRWNELKPREVANHRGRRVEKRSPNKCNLAPREMAKTLPGMR
jgi:hypothetical protein